MSKSRSVNKVILIGNVGKDPEVKYTPSGTPVAKFSLATNEAYKDKSGEWQERVEWHNVVAWQRLAEIVGEYVQQGRKLYIEGRLQTSNWEDKQSGDKKYRTEIIAQSILLLGNGNGQHNTEQEPPQRLQQPTSRRYEQEINADEGGISEHDIPF